MPPLSPPSADESNYSSDADVPRELEEYLKLSASRGAQRLEMGWGMAKTRAAHHPGGNAVLKPSIGTNTSPATPMSSASSSYDRHDNYFSQYGHSHTRPDRQPAVRTPSNERLHVGAVVIKEGYEGEDVDVTISGGPYRDAMPARAPSSAAAFTASQSYTAFRPDSGSELATRPSTRWRPHSYRSAEPPMLETSEEENEDDLEEYGFDAIYSDLDDDADDDIDLNDVRALLDWQVESADQQQYQYHASSSNASRRPSAAGSSSIGDDNSLVLEDLLYSLPASSSSVATPTRPIPRLDVTESLYGSQHPSIHPSLGADHLQTLSYAKYRQARLLDRHNAHGHDAGTGVDQVRDDRSSPILGLAADDEDQEGMAEGNGIPDGALQEHMSTTRGEDMKLSRPSRRSAGYWGDGKSSIRVSEGNASIMQEFEMVSPRPLPFDPRSSHQLPRSVTPSPMHRIECHCEPCGQ